MMRIVVCAGVEHRVSQLAEFSAADFRLSHMDGATETPAVPSLFAGCCRVCYLSRHSAVCIWISTQ